MNKYNISVFGLGYVGLVTSCCLAKIGHNIIGVDIDKQKVESINNTSNKINLPIYEPDLENLITQAQNNNLLYATDNINQAIENTDISFVCVGTPSLDNGSCNTEYINTLLKDIGLAIAKRNIQNKTNKKNSDLKIFKHLIIIRSTVPPGTVESEFIPIIEKYSKLKNNKDFYICFHPEFLREGIAIDDFFNPPKYILGLDYSNKTIINILANIYNINKNIIITTNYRTAELIKYTDNIWHATKVSFANEIGMLAKNYNIDAVELMDIFCIDTKLNISSYYLKPGLSYGGSCLPKEVASINYLINKNNLDMPLIKSISTSNNLHTNKVFKFIKNSLNNIVNNINKNKFNKINLSWYGISFKENTNDIRNSIQLELLNKLCSYISIKHSDNPTVGNLINKLQVYNSSNININNLIQTQKILSDSNNNSYHYDFYTNSFKDLIDNTNILILAHNLSKYNDHSKYNKYIKLINDNDDLYVIDLAGNGLNKDNYVSLF